jgi:UDP-N-acetylmuramoyl-tripeptide--D-alanyl-D-alanine ligase
MMIKLSLIEAALALKQSPPSENPTFEGVSIDTRTVAPGNLFVAIKGPSYDAHHFIKEAEDRGAIALVVERKVDSALPQIIVENTQIALGQLAHYWRKKFSIPVVGITGSVGKTTTKQMTASILSQAGKTLYSEGNKNNYYGVPLTLFQLNSEHQYAVIEMGADRPGEIDYLAKIVEPDVAVITTIAGVHLEVSEGIGFGSLEGVFDEKTKLFSALKEEGVAILNSNDQFYSKWLAQFPSLQKISFGEKADVMAQDLAPNENLQYEFTLVTPNGNISLQLSSIGRHNINNALAASAAAIALNIPLEKIKRGLENIPIASQRMAMHRTKQGALLIDDSYNANVLSVPAVMETLASFPGKRVMVFGDMLEIGPSSREEHYKIGLKAKELKLDAFFAYGNESLEAVKAFGAGGTYFTNQAELIKSLEAVSDDKTVIAVKGSRGMKLEKVVSALRGCDL